MNRNQEYKWENFKNSKLALYLVILSILGFFMLFIYCQRIERTAFKNELIENPTIILGEVKKLKKVYKDHDRFEYTFKYNDRLYSGSSHSNGKSGDYSDLIGHFKSNFFPVVISAKNPKKYSSILVVPEDFEEYGLKFPDSLNWVLKYIDR